MNERLVLLTVWDVNINGILPPARLLASLVRNPFIDYLKSSGHDFMEQDSFTEFQM